MNGENELPAFENGRFPQRIFRFFDCRKLVERRIREYRPKSKLPDVNAARCQISPDDTGRHFQGSESDSKLANCRRCLPVLRMKIIDDASRRRY